MRINNNKKLSLFVVSLLLGLVTSFLNRENPLPKSAISGFQRRRLLQGNQESILPVNAANERFLLHTHLESSPLYGNSTEL